MNLQPSWEMLEQRICPRCIDGDGTGACRLPARESCPLKLFLPEIITAVIHAPSDSITTYISSLRNNVCVRCEHEAADATCRKRNDLECALDRYFPLVVEIIETVHATSQFAEVGTGRS